MSEKVLNSASFVKPERIPERLPPTENSLRYHSYQCYYQILKWKGAEKNTKADDLGWYVFEGRYYPKTTDKTPSPESLLKIIHCYCKSEFNHAM